MRRMELGFNEIVWVSLLKFEGEAYYTCTPPQMYLTSCQDLVSSLCHHPQHFIFHYFLWSTFFTII